MKALWREIWRNWRRMVAIKCIDCGLWFLPQSDTRAHLATLDAEIVILNSMEFTQHERLRNDY